jgi:ABC-type sugar transport system ATPase subunit
MGIAYLSEDRKGDGLVLGMSSAENFSLPSLPAFCRGGWVRRKLIRERFQQHVAALDIRLAAHSQPAVELSGGNQQKLVLAKWLETDSRVVIFDEPTRGIDVGAKYEIYLLMNRLAEAGKAVIMISSELEEVLGMSDRILVMHEGRIKGELTDVSTASQADILSMAVA